MQAVVFPCVSPCPLMGTCYSSKSKSASHPYTTVPMAASSQDDAHRALRPTPYARGGSSAGGGNKGGSSVQRCIPPPMKYRSLHASEKYSTSSSTAVTDGQMKDTQPAKDDTTIAENNANNNFVNNKLISRCIPSEKTEECEKKQFSMPKQEDIKCEGSPCADATDQVKVQYCSTKIPTKVTALLSGLPKPQIAVITNRASTVTKGTSASFLHNAGNLNEKQSDVQRVSPDKESVSDKSHSSGDSSSTEYDSGMGQSLSDNLGNLKSKEGSSSEFTEKLIQNGNEKKTIFSSLSAREVMQDTVPSRTGDFIQPGSYGAYRGILSYRHISPLKKAAEVPQWKRAAEPKGAKVGQHRPVIAKGILSRGAKAVLSVDTVKEELSAPCSEPKLSVDSGLSPQDEENDGSPQHEAYLSPASDVENRGFLIDDDISDQPGLIALERSKPKILSVKKSVSELHALQNTNCHHGRLDRPIRERHSMSSDVGSSCSSLASDDLMLDFDRSMDPLVKDSPEILASPKIKPSKTSTPARRTSYAGPLQQNEKRNSWESSISDEGNNCIRRASELPRWSGRTSGNHLLLDGSRLRTSSLPLRPPRQLVLQECDGGVKLDASSHRSMCQDLNSVKTMLLRLRRVLQDAETLNPFEQTSSKNIFYQALARTDLPAGFTSNAAGDTPVDCIEVQDVMQENVDLKRQLVLMQQQLEDKDRTIHLLQQQMMKYMKIANAEKEVAASNAAVQTERPKFLDHFIASEDSCSGRLVSFRIGQVIHFEHSQSFLHVAGNWTKVCEVLYLLCLLLCHLKFTCCFSTLVSSILLHSLLLSVHE
ncbi:uncharacterized protein LOC135368752 isoform X3 [Ornithodoros turicata]|uniref:uncharacterized protein LOC135368752 isoform X3 n=1 Tax=Ornithodoros turicata TaxID=34597 RepID=UPI0031387BBD